MPQDTKPLSIEAQAATKTILIVEDNLTIGALRRNKELERVEKRRSYV
jgi:hypothetical protein